MAKFLPGQSGNPAGRAVGTRTFKTKWEGFIEKVAKENGLAPEDIDNELFKIGLKKAREGDYQFYKDIHDRCYGKAKDTVDLTMNGKLEVDIASKQRIDEAMEKYVTGTSSSN